MKFKLVIIILCVLSVLMTLLFYLKEDIPFEIITCPSILSYYKSNETEVFQLQILTNDPDNYHLSTSYISSSVVSDISETNVIPVTISSIKVQEETYIYHDKSYQFVDLTLKIAFDSPDFLIDIEDAILRIHYTNDEIISLRIGDLNYRFFDDVQNDLLIGNLQSTVLKVNDISSVSGIAIELTNNSTENIVITSAQLGTNMATVNNFLLTEIYQIPDLFSTPGDVVGNSEYNLYGQYEGYDKHIFVRENSSTLIYIPLNYKTKKVWLQRFYFTISYEISGEIREMIIDDIPYIRTNLFQPGRESEFQRYVYTN